MTLTPDDAALIRGGECPADEITSFREWYPVLFDREGGESMVWWRHVGEERFTDPFFHDTLARSSSPRLVTRTPLAALSAAVGPDPLNPTGFIFHTSRCGSTLVGQCLAALPRCVVLSEPPAVDSFLRHAVETPGGGFDAPAFADLVRVLGRRRLPEERDYFIKFDSWHVRFLPLIRAAFPDTPCLFLYRRPGEVLASHRRQRGRQMVPGLVPAMMLGLGGDPAPPGDLDGYCARVLAATYGAAVRFTSAGGLKLVNYDQLPAATWTAIPDSFSMTCSADEIEAMKDRAKFHSKRPADAFAGDPADPATDHDRVRREVEPLYDELERLRETAGERTAEVVRPWPLDRGMWDYLHSAGERTAEVVRPWPPASGDDETPASPPAPAARNGLRPDRLQLPLAFDPASLLRDLRNLAAHDWVPHFVQQNYRGDWSVLPLRGPAGAKHPVMMIYPDPTCREFADTPLLDACPYFREVLAAFRCPLRSVRLMRLGPGSEIKEHSDPDLSFEDGTVRLHVPVETNDGVEFDLNRTRVVMAAGSCWYLRLTDPHRVANRGRTDRVHLVIDATVNDWLAGLFGAPAGPGYAPSPNK